MIISACVLHNLCILSDDEIEDYIELAADYNVQPNVRPGVYANEADGIAKRNALVNYLQ